MHQPNRDSQTRDDALTVSGENYARWIAEYDVLSDAGRSAIRSECQQLKRRPLISLVISTADASLDLLADSLISVRKQLYGTWEVCLPVAAELSSQTPGSPAEPGLDDWRVRKIQVPGSYSHLAATNAALAETSGDFVGFLFPGDRLSEDALYQIATAITADDDADIFYTDEDSIDSSGLRQEPRFKPGWDRDLLLAGNYVGQFAVFRRTLLQHLGELRESAGDASSWDLLLRAAAVLTDDRIQHLPFVGYHRRKKESGDGSEPAISDTASRILSEHLRSCGEPSAEFMPAAPGTNSIRVVRQLPHPEPFVSIIVPTRDRVDLLQQCVEGVLNRTDYSRLELLIVNNDSRDPDTLAFLAAIPDKDRRVRVLQHPGTFNYSAINNAAARKAQGDVLVLLNNDIEVISPPWLGEMVSHVVRLEVGAVGAKLLYPDGRLQHGGIVLGPGGAVVHLQRLVDRFEPGYLNQTECGAHTLGGYWRVHGDSTCGIRRSRRSGRD